MARGVVEHATRKRAAPEARIGRSVRCGVGPTALWLGHRLRRYVRLLHGVLRRDYRSMLCGGRSSGACGSALHGLRLLCREESRRAAGAR